MRKNVMNNDEMRQIHREAFDRIILGLLLISLVGGAIALISSGVSSAWFIRSSALLAMTLIAFALRRAGQFVVAAYVLVLELIGLVVGIFFQANTVTSFIFYLFIPIIIITELILTPMATLAITILSILASLLMITLTYQFTLANLIILLPPFVLMILTALLITQSGRYMAKLGNHLLENKKLLRERTLEMLKALEDVDKLQQRGTELEQQFLKVKVEADQSHQRLAQRDNKLQRLIRGTIQELNNSIKELEQAIEKMSEMPDLGEEAGLIDKAWRKIYHLTNLAINLEEIAYLENSEPQLNYEPVEIGRLLSEVTGMARGLAREKDLEIRYRIPENLPTLQADPIRVRQALLHVLSNAVKYTDHGVIEIQAELNDGELVIFVSDTGMGMQREELELIFEEFGRSNQETAKWRQGSGLGLTISKRLIELHGGRMRATSVLGVGSTFYITLPLRPARDKVPTPVTQPAVAQPAAISQPKFEPEFTVPASSKKKDPVLSIPRPVNGTPPALNPNLGPVARLSPAYTSRFVIALLSLFLIITVIATTLAIFNGPLQTDETGTRESFPTSDGIVMLPVAQTPPLTGSLTLVATATLPPTTTPTPTPTTTAATLFQPTSTSTLLPTQPTLVAPAQSATVITRLEGQIETGQGLPPTKTPTPTTTPPTPTQILSPTGVPTEEPTVTPTLAPPTAAPIIVAQPTAPPVQQRLAFVKDQNGARSTSLINFDNGTSQVIAIETTANSGLSWSRTGQVLFTADQGGDLDIYIANADGSRLRNLTQVTGDDVQPAWSPDGRKIAFSSGRTGNFDIYVIDVDGSNLVQLTTSRGFDEWPVWSPDGQKIAFVSDRDGNVEIYTMNVDGGNQQRITNNPADDWPAVWSPDGSRLLFASNRDQNWNLYIIDAAGNNTLRLTNDPANEQDPTWSPDGRTIAFASDQAGHWDIYTLPVSPENFREISRAEWTQITSSPADERNPVWLP